MAQLAGRAPTVTGRAEEKSGTGQEVGFLVGDRKEIPTEPDPLATGRQTLDEAAAALPATPRRIV